MTDSKAKKQPLLEASFDERLKTYFILQAIMVCIFTVVGIVLLPIVIPLVIWRSRIYFESLYCELTPRSLNFGKGVWFRTERAIPLDKIQDLTFREGPILRALGLSMLSVETAGSSGAQGGADLSLVGLKEADAFRQRVLEQRDVVTDIGSSSRQSGEASAPQSGDQAEVVALLTEIRDSLKKLESR